MVEATLEKARQVKSEVSELLKNRSEVMGIGIAPDYPNGYSVKINLSTPLPREFNVPTCLQGVKISTQVIGKILFL
jgi:hypothetical protein